MFFKWRMPINTIKPKPSIFKQNDIFFDCIGCSVIYTISNLDGTCSILNNPRYKYLHIFHDTLQLTEGPQHIDRSPANNKSSFRLPHSQISPSPPCSPPCTCPVQCYMLARLLHQTCSMISTKLSDARSDRKLGNAK